MRRAADILRAGGLVAFPTETVYGLGAVATSDAAVAAVYRALGAAHRVKYVWYAGDHDFPPVARKAAVDWLRRWLGG